jgi:hypothetical protein
VQTSVRGSSERQLYDLCILLDGKLEYRYIKYELLVYLHMNK